jgi:hypothetical protein
MGGVSHHRGTEVSEEGKRRKGERSGQNVLRDSRTKGPHADSSTHASMNAPYILFLSPLFFSSETSVPLW